jgi:hypothetical protein
VVLAIVVVRFRARLEKEARAGGPDPTDLVGLATIAARPLQVRVSVAPPGLRLTAGWVDEDEPEPAHAFALPWPVAGRWQDDARWREARATIESRFGEGGPIAPSLEMDGDVPAAAGSAVRSLFAGLATAVPATER